MKYLTGQHIVVIDNGFVVVGNCDPSSKYVVITKGAFIRRWGTTKGLGELVDGPTKETIRDPVESIFVPRERIVFAIPSRWKL